MMKRMCCVQVLLETCRLDLWSLLKEKNSSASSCWETEEVRRRRRDGGRWAANGRVLRRRERRWAARATQQRGETLRSRWTCWLSSSAGHTQVRHDVSGQSVCVNVFTPVMSWTIIIFWDYSSHDALKKPWSQPVSIELQEKLFLCFSWSTHVFLSVVIGWASSVCVVKPRPRICLQIRAQVRSSEPEVGSCVYVDLIYIHQRLIQKHGTLPLTPTTSQWEKLIVVTAGGSRAPHPGSSPGKEPDQWWARSRVAKPWTPVFSWSSTKRWKRSGS